jgi:hypothetical protein
MSSVFEQDAASAWAIWAARCLAAAASASELRARRSLAVVNDRDGRRRVCARAWLALVRTQ